MAAKISENVTTLHHGLAYNYHHFDVYNNILWSGNSVTIVPKVKINYHY